MPGLAASPFGSADTTQNYALAQGFGGAVSVTWTTPQSVLELLWGTVDTDPTRNVITFGSGGVGDVVDGQQISAAALAQGFGNIGDGASNVLVEISGLSGSFTNALFSDGALPAFEFSLAAAPVPAPLVGAGIPGLIAGCLGLLGLARRRRNCAASV